MIGCLVAWKCAVACLCATCSLGRERAAFDMADDIAHSTPFGERRPVRDGRRTRQKASKDGKNLQDDRSRTAYGPRPDAAENRGRRICVGFGAEACCFSCLAQPSSV